MMQFFVFDELIYKKIVAKSTGLACSLTNPVPSASGTYQHREAWYKKKSLSYSLSLPYPQ